MNKIIICRTKSTEKEIIGEECRVEDEKGANVFSFFSLERSWKDNQREVSCIPAARYLYKKCLVSNNIPYEHLIIEGVPGRSGICVHALNYFSQSEGCIGVGSELGDINKDGEIDILQSRDTLSKILSLISDEGIIDIIEKF